MLKTVWLEDLLALAQTRNFARAAELRHVTQPGLSRRIQSLEAWAQAPLVDREAQPLRLTPAGEMLLEVATEVLSRLGALRQRLRPQPSRPQVRIAAPHLLSISFFPRWLPQMRQRVEGVELAVQSLNLQTGLAALAAGEADLAICLLDPARDTLRRLPAELRPTPSLQRVLGRDRLLPLSAPAASGVPQHRLGGASAAMLDYTEDCSLQWTLALARAGWPLQRLDCRGRNQFSDGLRLMALGGLGLAWLPESTTLAERAQGLLVPAGPARFNVELEIVAVRPPRPLSPWAERLWQLLAEATPGTAVPPPTNQAVELAAA
ncbi:LysR family transcriptional regulator [Roseateles sp. DAIF2]|uniref:LysR family transcriptional regulator n=1 Tax=Roseateles sp. DAIF2 TaxID=2714952 RepID=UPI0018A2E329|nr:LysR family transcriptional regulator [Roseateles sp. DAIF2]QPF74113.1 LysR family transcriptional regulator [Roseateles sp. DAIF2]